MSHTVLSGAMATSDPSSHAMLDMIGARGEGSLFLQAAEKQAAQALSGRQDRARISRTVQRGPGWQHRGPRCAKGSAEHDRHTRRLPDLLREDGISAGRGPRLRRCDRVEGTALLRRRRSADLRSLLLTGPFRSAPLRHPLGCRPARRGLRSPWDDAIGSSFRPRPSERADDQARSHKALKRGVARHHGQSSFQGRGGDHAIERIAMVASRMRPVHRRRPGQRPGIRREHGDAPRLERGDLWSPETRPACPDGPSD